MGVVVLGEIVFMEKYSDYSSYSSQIEGWVKFSIANDWGW